MIDRLLAPVLTFILLAAGTAAIVSSLFATPARPALQLARPMTQAVIVMEPVIITGKRDAVASQVATTDAPATASRPAAGGSARGVLMRQPRD